MSLSKQMKYWSLIGVTLALGLYFLGNVILPFILGIALAYMINPLADRLQGLGLNRAASVSIIASIAVLTITVMAVLIIPTILEQARQLISFLSQSADEAPLVVERIDTWLKGAVPLLSENGITLHNQMVQLAEALKTRSGAVLGGLFSSTLGLVNIAVLFVITPVVTFYVLLDWQKMVAAADDLLPRHHAGKVRQIIQEIDGSLASFIRGQMSVCFVLGLFYATALVIAGLKFGIVVGAIAGILTFIPYVGALVGGALSIGLALFQFWGAVEIDGEVLRAGTDWTRIGAVAVIFVVGQFLEGNVLTPRLVGSSIGLHPVWLMFALSVFGALFGFVGMLIAVPIAAMIGVLVRHGLDGYKTSPLYCGNPDRS